MFFYENNLSKKNLGQSFSVSSKQFERDTSPIYQPKSFAYKTDFKKYKQTHFKKCIFEKDGGDKLVKNN